MNRFERLYALYAQQKAARVELAELEPNIHDNCDICRRCKQLRDELTEIDQQIDKAFSGGDANG